MFHWKPAITQGYGTYSFFGLSFWIFMNSLPAFMFYFTMCIFTYFQWLFIVYLSSKVVYRAGDFMTMVVLLLGIVITLIKGPKCWTATVQKRWISVCRFTYDPSVSSNDSWTSAPLYSLYSPTDTEETKLLWGHSDETVPCLNISGSSFI